MLKGRPNKEQKENCVDFLLKSKREKLKTQEVELSQKAYEVVKARIPETVMVVFENEKTREYLHQINRTVLSGCGLDREYIYFPKNAKSDYLRLPRESAHLTCTKSEAKKVLPLVKKIGVTKREIHALEQQLLGLFNSLGTKKRIAEQFPELTELLSDGGVLLPAIFDVDNLKKQLKS